MDIADIATQDYVEVPADERLGQLRTVFDDGRPKAVVLTEDGDYAGVVTQKAFLQSHIDDGAKAAALRQHAPEVDRDEDVREVARVLVEGGTTVAPVYEGESLWGIVTEDAILEAVLPNLDAITVGQIHSEDVVTVTDGATVGQAINRLREHGISRLPVLDDGLLAGVLTAHDLVAFATRNEQRSTTGERSGDVDRMLDLPVYDVMSSPVVTVAADETVRVAVERMLDEDFSGLVVTPAGDGGGDGASDGSAGDGAATGDDGVVAGVVTKTDVLRALTYTDEDHMDVQITNIDLLDADRSHVRESIEAVVDKYQRMQVRHAHVRLHEHKEKLRGTPLVLCKIRLRTNRGQIAGSGEGYGAKNAFHVALDTLERNVLEVKGVHSDEEYRGQLLRKMGEL